MKLIAIPLSTCADVCGFGWSISISAHRITDVSWPFSNAEAISHYTAEATIF